MEKLKTLWSRIIESLWFIPSALTLACAALAILLIRLNERILGDADARDLWWLFGGDADGAKTVLQVISGSIITVTGVLFSVTMIVLQLASSQFTPRVLRQFMADRPNQLVLGVFIGTFTYTLLVLRTVRSENGGDEFVPHAAVTGGVVLALISIGFLIYFINHTARSAQASHVIQAVTRDTLKELEAIFPERLEPGTKAVEPSAAELIGRSDEPRLVHSRRAGYVQGIDHGRLAKLAERHGILISVDVEIGSYVLPGQVIMSVWPAHPDPQDAARRTDQVENALCDSLVFGPERTARQDLKHGVLELMDIAVKAMSPSINDPTTAVNAMHRMGEVLHEMAWRRPGDRAVRGEDGRLLVVTRRPTLESVVALGFNQVRHYSVENATVAISLLRILAELAATVPEHSRGPFIEQLNAVHASARSRIGDAGDAQRMEREAAAALSRAATPGETRRDSAPL